MEYKTDIQLNTGDLVKFDRKAMPYVNDYAMFDKVGIVVEIGQMHNQWNDGTFDWAKVQFSDGAVEEWMGYFKIVKRCKGGDNNLGNT